MLKLLVIADDYTGAMDTGVHFSKCGAGVLVSSNPEIAFNNLLPDIEVLAVNLEVRHCDPEIAAEKVRHIASRGLAAGIPYTYLKIDSTMRGNVGSALSAVMDVFHLVQIPFIPAYPKIGRTTDQGTLYVNGVPLAKTVYASDPIDPVRFSEVSNIIAEQTSLSVKTISRNDPYPVPETPDPCICVFDAKDDRDLENIGQALNASGNLKITSGSGGFAEILSRWINFSKSPSKQLPAGKRILLISGSVADASIEQLAQAEKLGYGRFTLTNENKNNPDFVNSAEGIMLVDAVEQQLLHHGKAIIQSVASRSEIEPDSDKKDISQNIAKSLGWLACRILERGAADSLVIFGGDTLMATMNEIGCTGLRPVTEIAPGIVSAVLVGSKFSGTIVTKAGGFGSPDAVSLISNYIEALAPSHA